MAHTIPTDTAISDGETARGLASAFKAGRAHDLVTALSASDYAGRPTGHPGSARSAAYLAAAFEGCRLRVSTQRFDAADVLVLTAPPTLKVEEASGTRVLEHRVDFAEHPRSAYQPRPRTGVTVQGPQSPAEGRWVILDAVPPGNGLARLADALAEAHACGLLVPQFADPSGFLNKRLLGGSAVSVPVIAVRADVLTSLADKRVTGVAPGRRVTVTGANIIAEMPGTDPALSREPLLLTAHYDGVGDDPGRHFPAAGDNASGVAVIHEIARVLSRAPRRPARPVYFVAVDAEEVGAQGSRAHAQSLRQQGLRPLVLNLDMVGRFHGAISAELSQGADVLRDALDMAGRLLGIPLVVGAVSSDNRSYAAAGFPAVGLGSGAAHYHSPLDGPELVEREALARAGRLLLAAVHLLASPAGATTTAVPTPDRYPTVADQREREQDGHEE